MWGAARPAGVWNAIDGRSMKEVVDSSIVIVKRMERGWLLFWWW